MFDNLSRSQKQKAAKYGKIIIIFIVIGIGYLYFNQQDNQPETLGSSQEETAQVAEPTATVDINRTFTIPLLDEEGEEFSSLKFELESAERRDEILVKGKKASAIEGRDFLLLNLKIANGSEQGVNVNTRNYVRLSVNGNQDEWLAPDIHNDPVEVQAISTKRTRIGFPVNETDVDLSVQVGEISGEKELIELNI